MSKQEQTVVNRLLHNMELELYQNKDKYRYSDINKWFSEGQKIVKKYEQELTHTILSEAEKEIAKEKKEQATIALEKQDAEHKLASAGYVTGLDKALSIIGKKK